MFNDNWITHSAYKDLILKDQTFNHKAWKSVMEELDDLKPKKKKLETEAEGLAKSADRYSLKAEKAKNIRDV